MSDLEITGFEATQAYDSPRIGTEEKAMMTAFEAAARKVLSGANARSKARSLVAQMSVEEKLGCLDGDTPFWPGLGDMVNGGYSSHPWPAARVQRLGIPGLDFADGPRGRAGRRPVVRVRAR